MSAVGIDLLGSEVVEPRSKPRRALKQADYAEKYGYSIRQVKNWIKDGRDKKSPPPLDTPAEMPNWFESVYSRRCPEKLWTAVESLASPPTSEAPRDLAPIALPELKPGELGILQTLQRVREADARNHKLYLQALEQGDQARANFHSKEITRLSAELRQLEKQVQTLNEKTRVVVPAVEVRNEVTSMLTSLYRQLMGGGDKFRDRLQKAETPEQFATAWKLALNEVFGVCSTTEFAEPFSLDKNA